MEIQVYNPTQAQPLPTVKWNYTEVKQWVEDGLQAYKGRVYTNETIAEAKKDRANLNKLATAIDDKRKEMKALYLAPYEQFEKEAKELVNMIKTVSAEIDAQVKAYEDFRKQEKQQFIVEQIYKPLIGNLAELVPYERLHNPKWLNVTSSVSDVGDDMARTIEKIESGLKAIDQLNLDADMSERVKGVFLRDFDLASAIAEKEHLEKQKALLRQYEEKEREAASVAQQAQNAPKVYDASDPDAFAKAKPGDVIRFGGPGCETAPVDETQPTQPAQRPVVEEEKLLTVAFRIRVTKAQLDGLGAYMRANGIKPERI